MPITSNASRNINQFKSSWFEKKTFKQLTFRKISKAGRNKYGRIIIWTKSSIKQRLLFPKINYSFRYRWIGVVGTFRLIPFQNKLTALVFFLREVSLIYKHQINLKKYSLLFIFQVNIRVLDFLTWTCPFYVMLW